LGSTALRHLRDGSNRVLLSAVVVWEIAVKRSLGKLEAPNDFVEALLTAGASPMAIDLSHASLAGELPWHHRDPFDRLLVAQALLEGAVVVSGDPQMARYGAPVVW
jgi:PIN domain nuclease of toxin-antitoxin system